MNYKNASGIIGTWKNYNVRCINKKSYNVHKDSKEILVITDDNMRMILDGNVIGILSNSGTVVEVPHVKYVVEAARETIDSTVGFDEYTKEVDRFFAELKEVKYD